jgi:hypothetical protein
MNLDTMAREMTGDGKSPNLFFVSQGPKVVTLATSHKAAMGAAYALGNVDPVLVTDRAEGILWANVKGQRQLARGGGGAAVKGRAKREAAPSKKHHLFVRHRSGALHKLSERAAAKLYNEIRAGRGGPEATSLVEAGYEGFLDDRGNIADFEMLYEHYGV